MVSKLTSEHFELIRTFSRKISKGVNSDDLSQHVILKLLEKNQTFVNELIDKKEFKFYIWRVIERMFKRDHSTYNREEYGTHHYESRLKTVNLDKWITLNDNDWDGYEFLTRNRFFTCDYFRDAKSLDVSEFNVKDIIDKANLTDVERMYLNAYIESNCNYTTCSSNLDISTSTISKYVKRAIEKCKESL